MPVRNKQANKTNEALPLSYYQLEDQVLAELLHSLVCHYSRQGIAPQQLRP